MSGGITLSSKYILLKYTVWNFNCFLYYQINLLSNRYGISKKFTRILLAIILVSSYLMLISLLWVVAFSHYCFPLLIHKFLNINGVYTMSVLNPLLRILIPVMCLSGPVLFYLTTCYYFNARLLKIVRVIRNHHLVSDRARHLYIFGY